MPELPEVENIRLQIAHLAGAQIIGITQSHFTLRYKLTLESQQAMLGTQIDPCGPQRLGRYLLLPIKGLGHLMIHLGMTGAVRIDPQGISRIHDHLSFQIKLGQNKTHLVYNDARRFGGASLMAAQTLLDAKKDLRLGEEPTVAIPPGRLLSLYFSPRPIKPLLMDNSLVTGIGNIYASEVCHQARISPYRLGNSLSMLDAQNLSDSIYSVIRQAIANGGSTLRNYVHVDGSSGEAQQEHRVYARSGQRCSRCGSSLVQSTQAGRTTFCCPTCQL